VNGINLVATRADLLDRALLLTLASMSDAERRTEQDCLDEFYRLRPYLLGAMFDALSVAIKTLPDVDIAELPRMADFARWGCAIARHLGCDDAEFLSALGVNAAAQNDTAVENSPVAQAVLRLVEEVGEWEDTPAVTLQRLASIAGELQLDLKGKSWPKQPAHLTRRLNEVAPNLKRLGVTISMRRTGSQRFISLRGSGSGVTGVTESDVAVTADAFAVIDDAASGSVPDSAWPVSDANDASDGTLVGDAELVVRDQKLLVQGAVDRLPDDLRLELREHKAELMLALGVPLNITIATILAEIRPHLPPALRKLPDDRLLTLVNWTLISAFETAIRTVRR
jgi:hypothetical protein